MTGPVAKGSARLRDAGAADAPEIARLHVASWRSAYRGILADAFLDGPVEAERLALWRDRLAAAPPGVVTVLCEHGDALLGFRCLFVDEDPRWGSFVNNLHVAPDGRGRGTGHVLMRALAERAAPGRPVYLWCLDGNAAARRFYERVGGAAAERRLLDEPDGGIHPATRFVWSAPAAITASLAAACG